MPTVMSEGNLAPSLRGSMEVVASCCGDCFQRQGLGDTRSLYLGSFGFFYTVQLILNWHKMNSMTQAILCKCVFNRFFHVSVSVSIQSQATVKGYLSWKLVFNISKEQFMHWGVFYEVISKKLMNLTRHFMKNHL